MKAMVSVCMITYNHQDYVIEALQGVLQQICDFDIELIVSNDCSTDQTHHVISEFLKDNKAKNIKVNYFNHPKNLGMMSNFIFTLNKCKGKYIALCEGDDYWTDPSKLQRQVNFLEANKDCCLCHHSQFKLNETGLFKDSRFKDLNDGVIHNASDLFSFKIQPQTRSMLFRNCLTSEDMESDFLKQAVFGDFAICFLLAQYGKIGYINQEMAVYRITKSGVSHAVLGKNKDYFKSRLRLVEMWCEAFNFLNCDKSSFKVGILKLYTSGMDRIGRKNSLPKILYHWSKMKIGTPLFIEIYFKLLLKSIKRT